MLLSGAAVAESVARVADSAGFSPATRIGVHGMAPATLAALKLAIEHWHEFYLLAGTAAVTLVGLLFVALSFHLDTLLQDEKAHLLGTARMAFTSFLYVLLMSLTFLVPDISPKLVAMFMLMTSLFLLGYAMWVMRSHRRRKDAGGFEQFLRRRYAATGFVAGVAIVSAAQFLMQPKPSWFYNFGFIIAIMLINASSISWDLLVHVGRLKLAQERKPHA